MIRRVYVGSVPWRLVGWGEMVKRQQQSRGAGAKASLKRATMHALPGYDPKPGELPMGRVKRG